MFKYLILVSLLVVSVRTQDVPPDWEISTISPTITTTEEPATTTLDPVTELATTTKLVITTTEMSTTTEERTTKTMEQSTTTVEPTTLTPEPTTITPESTPTITNTTVTAISATTSAPPPVTPSTSTIKNNVPSSPATDSPLPIRTTPKYPCYHYYPYYPHYNTQQCYFKKQYGFAQLHWTYYGLRYIYPIECFKCCLYQYSLFAGCYKVKNLHCNSMKYHYSYHK